MATNNPGGNPGATPHHGRNPKGDGQKSFMETLREVGGKELDPRRHESDLVVSVAGVVTGLMIAAIAVYKWFPVVSVVFLVCALIALWGRWVIRRQVLRDVADLATAKEGFAATGQEEYREFVRLRSQQMLTDNKTLTAYGRSVVQDYAQWAG